MAGLIPQGFIDELLARTDIIELIDKRVPLKRAGANHNACCPFHKEKSPSFTVNADKQFYYCFGCSAGGNALGFLMEYDNMSFPEAADYLAHQAGLEVPRQQSNSAREKFEQHKPLIAVLNDAQKFFTAQLRQHPQRAQAIDYLKDRGLNGVIARDFGIGFAPAGWDNLYQTLGTSDSQKQHLFTAGMLIEKDTGGHYDRFRNRITFPIKDSRGRIIGFGGRIIDPNDKPKYLNSPETPVFNKGNELYGLHEAKKANRRLSRLMVVEGYMDVISLAQMGIYYGVATLGTAIGSAHLKRLFKHTASVCFCFDGDDAGRRAAHKALAVTLPEMADDKDVRFLFLPDGHDPDTLVRQEGKDSFEARIESAPTISEYLFNSAANSLPLDTVDARAKFAQRGTRLINTLPAGNYKQLMQKELASRSGLDVIELDPEPSQDETPPYYGPPNDDYGPIDTTDAAYYSNATPEQHNSSAYNLAQQKQLNGLSFAHKACILLFNNPHLIYCALERKLPDSNDQELLVLKEIISCLRENPSLTTGGLYGRWMKQGNEHFVRSLLSAEQLCPKEGAEEELCDQLNALELTHARNTQREQIQALNHLNPAEMSDEQKQKVRQLMTEKVQKL